MKFPVINAHPQNRIKLRDVIIIRFRDVTIIKNIYNYSKNNLLRQMLGNNVISIIRIAI